MSGVDRRKRAAVLVFACALVFMANCQQFQISALGAILVPDLGLSSSQFSLILFSPMLFAIAFSIPAGVIADRWGTRWLIAGAVGISLVGSLMRCWAGGFAEMLAASILIGAAPTALNSSIVKIFGGWFGTKADFAMGWYYAASSGGMAVAFAASHLFGSPFGAFAASAAIVAALGAAWVLLIGRFNEAQERASMRCADGPCGEERPSGLQDLFHAAADRHVWVVAVMLGLGLASTETFSGFLPLALDASVSMAAAGLMTAALTVGSIIGCIMAPHARVRFKSYRRFLMCASILGALSLAFACISIGEPNAAVLFVTGALTAVCGPTIQGLPYQLPNIGERYAGSAGGIVNPMSLLATFLVPLGISSLFGEAYPLLLASAVACFGATVACVPLLPKPAALRGEGHEGTEDS